MPDVPLASAVAVTALVAVAVAEIRGMMTAVVVPLVGAVAVAGTVVGLYVAVVSVALAGITALGDGIELPTERAAVIVIVEDAMAVAVSDIVAAVVAVTSVDVTIAVGAAGVADGLVDGGDPRGCAEAKGRAASANAGISI